MTLYFKLCQTVTDPKNIYAPIICPLMNCFRGDQAAAVEATTTTTTTATTKTTTATVIKTTTQ